MLRRLGSSTFTAALVSRVAVRCSTDAVPNPKIEEMANLYSQLTLKEITQLQRLIFKNLGHTDEFYEQALLRGLGGGGGAVVAAAPGAAAVPIAAAAAAAETAAPAADAAPAEVKSEKKKVEKNTYDVKLSKFAPDIKIKLIKELRTVTNLPLKDAKDAIDKCPGLVQTNMGKDDAEKLKKLFEALGATVELI